jgi:hypothetical protein
MTDAPIIPPEAEHTLFRSEYEIELEGWLRRRFRSACIGFLIIGVFVFIFRMLVIGFPDQPGRGLAIVLTTVAAAGSMALIAWFLVAGRHRAGPTREQLLRGASIMVFLLGSIALVKGLIIESFLPGAEYFLLPQFFLHFIACLFLPWTPKESLRPTLPVLGGWAVGVIALRLSSGLGVPVLSILASPLILLPGLTICAWRLKEHSRRFRAAMIGRHFMSMRRELSEARSVHESMFPAPYDDGFVRFDYTYAPMRELGGDFVHLHVGAEGVVHLALIDVTGHGLTAALTVNRLYGELERLRAESPHAEPDEVIRGLNRYVYLTLSKHQIYATALCLMLDPYAGELRWASAGHPPAFRRGANGAVTPLPSTALLLGAISDREFATEPGVLEVTPGDVLLLYTDGAIEARSRRGTVFGVGAVRDLLQRHAAAPHWPQLIASHVHKHAAGRFNDDILIASLTLNRLRRASVASSRGRATLSVRE